MLKLEDFEKAIQKVKENGVSDLEITKRIEKILYEMPDKDFINNDFGAAYLLYLDIAQRLLALNYHGEDKETNRNVTRLYSMLENRFNLLIDNLDSETKLKYPNMEKDLGRILFAFNLIKDKKPYDEIMKEGTNFI